MKRVEFKLLAILAIFWVSIGISEELPKDCFGRYGGEMPGYAVERDGNMIEIDEHDVFITISEEAIIYLGGNLELSGGYTVFQQSKNEFAIKAELTNGKALTYDLDLVWNKKEQRMYITPKNGQSEAVLEYLGE